MKAFWVICVLSLGPAAGLFGEEKWEPLFDGGSLSGWKAPDMRFWSVIDGAITARSSEELPCKHNQFLVWQGGDLDDFVLRFRFRIEGTQKANSGVQVRSRVEEDGHVVGYQADITKPTGRFLGCLYDEHGRKMLAERGQRTVIRADGTKDVKTLATPEEVAEEIEFSEGGWNRYEITARGNTITLKINGVVTAEITDLQEAERELSGVLALQLHSGPPMTVQFKEILLKRL